MDAPPRPGPADVEAGSEWHRHVAVIAAYRDQHKVTTSDPRQVLGPYPEAGRPGHKAYWHAAESVLAARRLAGLDAPPALATPDAQARAEVAADVYRSLPADERAAISSAMAGRLGPLWFGDHARPDEDAATQPAHAATLASVLAEHCHTTITSEYGRIRPVPQEPLEAGLARRGPSRGPQPAPGRASSHSRPTAPPWESVRPPALPSQDGPRQRL